MRSVGLQRRRRRYRPARRARATRRRRRRCPPEGGEVEHDAAVDRHARPADAAATRRGGHRDARVVAHAEHRGDVGGGSRPGHRRRAEATGVPSEPQIMASGHQSRLAASSASGSTTTRHTSPSRSRTVAGTSATAPRSGLIRCRPRSAATAAAVRRRPARRVLGGRPPEIGAEQLRHVGRRPRRRVAREQHARGCGGEHVVERAGHLVAHGVARPRPGGTAARGRAARRGGVVGDEREDGAGVGAEAAGRCSWVPGSSAAAGGAKPSPPNSRSRFVRDWTPRAHRARRRRRRRRRRPSAGTS